MPRGWLGDESFSADPVCLCEDNDDGLWFHRRGCEASVHPFVDEQTLASVDDAVECLVCSRGSGPGDAGAVLAALVSVIAEAQSRLPDAVADARECGYTWAEVALRLATTAGTAGRRYRDYVAWRAAVAARGEQGCGSSGW